MKKLSLILLFIVIATPFHDRAAEDFPYLILVNAENPLPSDFANRHMAQMVPLRHTRADGRAPQKMLAEAAEALDAMLDDAARAGFDDLSVTSAYRSRSYQQELFALAVKRYLAAGTTEEEARRQAKRYHARPGESEHETGLAADLHNLPTASVAFAETDAFRWLSVHAAEYGYILRYPAGKEALTGIAFEPWHFRYVGKEAAAEISALGISLEEYLAQK